MWRWEAGWGGLRPDAEPTNETLAAHEKGRETAGEARNRITERVFKRHHMPRVNNQLLGVFQLSLEGLHGGARVIAGT